MEITKFKSDENLQEFYLNCSKYKNFKNTKTKLAWYYNILKELLLPYQSVSTGLFSCDDVANIRENIYCASAVWALFLAYQRIDDDNGCRYELEHTTVKCMRGILFCYMQQVDNVEKFKASQSPEFAFHSSYNVHTGSILNNKSLDHLQLDIVALFVLYIIQMTSSGLQIIFTTDEVAFMQNLIFYLERSYRTSDFGLWGRGSKYNNGSAELHSSSVGAAKAVLESANGFNLYGKSKGAPWSTLWVDIDAHNRNRICLDSMLPKESKSKNVDAAQILMISFPFFAVDNEDVKKETLKEIKEQLEGCYGFKRFLGDGYKTVVEDESRQYYEPAEINYFQGIESEWPIFFIYLIIDGIITGNKKQVAEYQQKLEPLLKTNHQGFKIVPKFFYVTKENLEKERQKNKSTKRQSSFTNSDESPIFLWGQSLYLISNLLAEGMILPGDIDPIKRYIPLLERNKVSMRYSTVDNFVGDTVIQISLITENKYLVDTLSAYGFSVQTPEDVQPIQIWSSQRLQNLYTDLGKLKRLGLSGRPNRPIGVLGTSKVYKIHDKMIVCYSLEFDTSDFYLATDINMLIENLLFSLQFLAQYWHMPRRPLFLFFLSQDMLEEERLEPILKVLSYFKHGIWNGVKIKLGRIQNFIASSVIETLDIHHKQDNFSQFLNKFQVSSPKSFESHQNNNDQVCYFLNLKTENHQTQIEEAIQTCKQPINVLLNKLFTYTSGFAVALILEEITKRKGLDFNTGKASCFDFLKTINQWATTNKLWSLVRFTSGICRKVVNSLAPTVSSILIRDKYLTLGIAGFEELVINNPLPPDELANSLYDVCSPYNIGEACLQQELILYLGQIFTKQPNLFDNILQIRIGWLVYAMRILLDESEDGLVEINPYQNKHVFLTKEKDVFDLSPSDLKSLLLEVLSVKHNSNICLLKQKQVFGALNRSPADFYSKVWLVLERSPEGLIINEQNLKQQPYLSDMCKNEVNWFIKVEEFFTEAHIPEFQYLIKETISLLATIFERNSELYFNKTADISKITNAAIDMYEASDSFVTSSHSESVRRFCKLSFQEATCFLTKSILKAFLCDNIVMKFVNECTTS